LLDRAEFPSRRCDSSNKGGPGQPLTCHNSAVNGHGDVALTLLDLPADRSGGGEDELGGGRDGSALGFG
jgi:hypothetical protein